MKKRIIIVASFIIVLSFALLTGCGGSGGSTDSAGDQDLTGSKYLGSWKAASVAAGDKTGVVDTGDIIVTLNDDGTGELYTKNEDGEETLPVTWSETEKGFKLADGADLEFTDDGDNVKASFFGVDIIFEKVE